MKSSLYESHLTNIKNQVGLGTNIIKVEVNENQEPVLSGRELHGFLEVSSNYTTWFKRMCEYGFEKNTDFIELWSDSKNGTVVEYLGSPQTMSSKGYEINHVVKLDMAKEIAMIQRSEKGKQARQYFLRIEKEWNTPEKVMARAILVANKQLQIANKQLAELQEVNEEMKPKAEYFDALVDRKLLTNIRDTAKEFGIKEKVFTNWLQDRKLCYRDTKRKLKPYSNKMDFFELKEFATMFGHADVQTLINPKGRETFRLLLIKDGLIEENDNQIIFEA